MAAATGLTLLKYESEVEHARRNADSELANMRAAIHGPKGPQQPPWEEDGTAAPGATEPKSEFGLFIHRGKAFPYASPREEVPPEPPVVCASDMPLRVDCNVKNDDNFV